MTRTAADASFFLLRSSSQDLPFLLSPLTLSPKTLCSLLSPIAYTHQSPTMDNRLSTPRPAHMEEERANWLRDSLDVPWTGYMPRQMVAPPPEPLAGPSTAPLAEPLAAPPAYIGEPARPGEGPVVSHLVSCPHFPLGLS